MKDYVNGKISDVEFENYLLDIMKKIEKMLVGRWGSFFEILVIY